MYLVVVPSSETDSTIPPKGRVVKQPKILKDTNGNQLMDATPYTMYATAP